MPFTTAALHAPAGERLVTAGGDVPEVRIHGPDGRLTARYTVLRDPVAPSPAEVRGLVDHWVEKRYYGAPSTVRNEWLDRMPIPERRPAYDRLRVSASGHIWARHYLLESDPAATPRWDVFALGGEYLGVVDTPPGLEITTILDHAVAGVFRDSLDVEYVRVHRLSTGPSDPSVPVTRIDSPEPNARVSARTVRVSVAHRRGDSGSQNR